MGIPAGQLVELTVSGENLAGPATLWTSLAPAPGDLKPARPRASSLAIELPASASAGVFAARLITGQGISNVRLLMVDDLPTIVDSSENISPAKARRAHAGSRRRGRADREQSVITNSARPAGSGCRLRWWPGGWVRRSIRSCALLDAGGRELAHSDDDDAIGADCRFVYQFTTAGEYLLELGDVRYQGNANYRYRLRHRAIFRW